MTVQTYRNLATSWLPDNREQRLFKLITIAAVVIALVFGLVISSLEVPPKERVAKKPVPERVAKFINEKKKQEVPKPKPTPPPKPKAKPTPKPKVARKKETEAEKRKPITKEEKVARDKASQSGLLALASEMSDLIDTSDVDQMLGGKVKKASSAAIKGSSVDTSALEKGVGEGAGTIASSDYVGAVGSTALTAREVAMVQQSLGKSERSDDVASDEDFQRGDNVRSEEEVSIVFDQNKGQLHSLYSRERRKHPGLKGKLVLEITIAPDGTVTAVKIVSSELNNPSLERRLVARVRQFRFEAKSVEPVTVTFPIEFLP